MLSHFTRWPRPWRHFPRQLKALSIAQNLTTQLYSSEAADLEQELASTLLNRSHVIDFVQYLASNKRHSNLLTVANFVFNHNELLSTDTLHSLLRGCNSNDNFSGTIELFWKGYQRGIPLDGPCYSETIHAALKLGRATVAEQAVQMAARRNVRLSKATLDKAAAACASSMSLQGILSVLQVHLRQHRRPDTQTLNSIVRSLRLTEAPLELIGKVKAIIDATGLSPDSHTYNLLLMALLRYPERYSSPSECCEAAMGLYHSMKDSQRASTQPTRDTFRYLLQAQLLAGDAAGLSTLLHDMQTARVVIPKGKLEEPLAMMAVTRAILEYRGASIKPSQVTLSTLLSNMRDTRVADVDEGRVWATVAASAAGHGMSAWCETALAELAQVRDASSATPEVVERDQEEGSSRHTEMGARHVEGKGGANGASQRSNLPLLLEACASEANQLLRQAETPAVSATSVLRRAEELLQRMKWTWSEVEAIAGRTPSVSMWNHAVTVLDTLVWLISMAQWVAVHDGSRDASLNFATGAAQEVLAAMAGTAAALQDHNIGGAAALDAQWALKATVAWLQQQERRGRSGAGAGEHGADASELCLSDVLTEAAAAVVQGSDAAPSPTAAARMIELVSDSEDLSAAQALLRAFTSTPAERYPEVLLQPFVAAAARLGDHDTVKKTVHDAMDHGMFGSALPLPCVGPEEYIPWLRSTMSPLDPATLGAEWPSSRLPHRSSIEFEDAMLDPRITRFRSHRAEGAFDFHRTPMDMVYASLVPFRPSIVGSIGVSLLEHLKPVLQQWVKEGNPLPIIVLRGAADSTDALQCTLHRAHEDLRPARLLLRSLVVLQPNGLAAWLQSKATLKDLLLPGSQSVSRRAIIPSLLKELRTKPSKDGSAAETSLPPGNDRSATATAVRQGMRKLELQIEESMLRGPAPNEQTCRSTDF